jgi:predicted permease
LQPADNQPGAPLVVVLGWKAWQVDFGGAADVVSRAVRMNGEPATIVGVMPRGFEFPVSEELWTNLRLPAAPAATDWFDAVQLLGRLAPGLSLAAAQTEVETVMTGLVADTPKKGAVGVRAVVAPFARNEIGRAFEVILWTWFTLAALVLALGCLNVANLLYARALRQRHELAVRAALGAGRGRLIRQMVCLSSLLAGLGAAGGVVVARWTAPWLNPLLNDPRKPYWVRIEADWHVILAVGILTAIVGVIAGIIPALRVLRLDPGAVLHDGGRATGHSLGRSGRGLAMVQMALAAGVLVVGAVLTRGSVRVARGQFPPQADRVLVARQLSSPTREGPDASPATLLPRLLERAEGLAGVETVAALGRGLETPIELPGMDPAERTRAGQFPAEAVSADYFAVFGVRPSRGRAFTPSEISARAKVVVVNESCARRFWPDRDPVGQQIRFEGWEGRLDWHTVIGVVPDLPMQRNRRQLHRPGIYHPLDLTQPARASLLVRTAGDPAALARPLRDALREFAPDRVFAAVRPMPEEIAESLQLLRLLSGLALVYGVSGLLLAALGIFGMQMFFVECRRREFGVRLALGARPDQISRLVLRRDFAQLAAGLAVGLAGGWGIDRVLQATSLLEPVAQFDAAALWPAAATLVLAALAGCWLPARRAANVDPMVALRCE